MLIRLDQLTKAAHRQIILLQNQNFNFENTSLVTGTSTPGKAASRASATRWGRSTTTATTSPVSVSANPEWEAQPVRLVWRATGDFLLEGVQVKKKFHHLGIYHICNASLLLMGI